MSLTPLLVLDWYLIMSGHSSRWTQIQTPSRRTLHHTWPLTPCSVALETCFLWKWGGQGWGDGENPWGNRRAGGVWGEVYVFSIPGQSHDWLSPMNREFGGHECLKCIPPPSSLIPHCLFSVSCPLRPFYTSLFSSSLFCLWLRCQTDGLQHKHLLEVRKASPTTLINKPKGNRFCKYNMFCEYRCARPLYVCIMLRIHWWGWISHSLKSLRKWIHAYYYFIHSRIKSYFGIFGHYSYWLYYLFTSVEGLFPKKTNPCIYITLLKHLSVSLL